MIDPKLDETGLDFVALCGHKWQCGPGGTGLLYVRNAPNAANGSPLPKFHLVRSSARDVPFDGSRGYDIGAALSQYGFPESSNWRALGDVVELWDKVGRGRIQTWHIRLATYFFERLIAAFGEEAILRPLSDPALQSGVVSFNPFPTAEQRMDDKLNVDFRVRILHEYDFRIHGRGVGPDGLTPIPNPDALRFPVGSIPNRDPDSLDRGQCLTHTGQCVRLEHNSASGRVCRSGERTREQDGRLTTTR